MAAGLGVDPDDEETVTVRMFDATQPSDAALVDRANKVVGPALIYTYLAWAALRSEPYYSAVRALGRRTQALLRDRGFDWWALMSRGDTRKVPG